MTHGSGAASCGFGASAVMHEYLFSFASGHFQGYQTAFFLINGVASALTLRWKPVGGRAIAGVAATLAFMLATSVLFFIGVAEVF